MRTGKEITYTTMVQDALEEGIKLAEKTEKEEVNKNETPRKENNPNLEYKKYLYRLMIIRNSISLICFTVLAIAFKNIWIVLLALFFTVSVEKEE